MPSHLLTNFERQKYYKNEPRFNGVFSRNNLSEKIKDRVYIINLDEYPDVGAHWFASFCKKIKQFVLKVLGKKHIPEEIKESIENKNIKANIFH